MIAEGARNLPIHPRPDAGPVSFIHNSGLLSVDVQHLAHSVLVIYVGGELDMLTGPPLQDHLGELLATRPDRLIIDLSQVSFMGSTGLSVFGLHPPACHRDRYNASAQRRQWTPRSRPSGSNRPKPSVRDFTNTAHHRRQTALTQCRWWAAARRPDDSGCGSLRRVVSLPDGSGRQTSPF